MLVLSLLRDLVKRYRLRFSPQNSLRTTQMNERQSHNSDLTCTGEAALPSPRPVLPVAELLGQVDIQDVRQDGDELRGITEGSADGVGWVDVVQFCVNDRSKVM